MAQLLRCDGMEETVLPADPEKGFSCTEIYTLLDCQIFEVVYLSGKEGYILLIDEEGKFREDAEARYNESATELLLSGRHIPGDWITGNALLIEDNGVEFQ